MCSSHDGHHRNTIQNPLADLCHLCRIKQQRLVVSGPSESESPVKLKPGKKERDAFWKTFGHWRFDSVNLLSLIKGNPLQKEVTHITLPTKVCLVKAMVFPVVMYGCESCTIKKAERRKIDAFELWCWRRLLRAPWTARRSNQSILKEISPEYSLEELMLKLKLQSFGHLMAIGKVPDAGKDWGWEEKGDNRGWDGWMASPTPWTWVWINCRSWW